MATAPMARLGWILLLLGLIGEWLAWRAHSLSQDFAPGMFTTLNWVLILAGIVPIAIGLALLVRRRSA